MKTVGSFSLAPPPQIPANHRPQRQTLPQAAPDLLTLVKKWKRPASRAGARGRYQEVDAALLHLIQEGWQPKDIARQIWAEAQEHLPTGTTQAALHRHICRLKASTSFAGLPQAPAPAKPQRKAA